MEETSMETGMPVPDTEPERPTLPASLALADPDMVTQFNRDLSSSVEESNSPGKPYTIAGMSGTSIQLADSSLTSRIIFEEVEKALVDQSMKLDLEETGVINWLPHTQKLVPLRTMGDGNCLLHALALAMWGVEDSSLILRRLLYIALVQDEEKGRLRKRWQMERSSQDSRVPGGGFQLETSQWDSEWEMVVKAAEDLRNDNPSHFEAPYKCLEEIHVFVMANILKRPIIVLADNVVRDFSGRNLAPNDFSGIYLPILWDPEQCIKSPIVLGFSVGHFAPLIRVVSPGSVALSDVLPIVRRDMAALPVHFMLPHEENAIQKKLYHFLRLEEIPSSNGPVTGVQLQYKTPPESRNLVKTYFTKAQNMFKVWKQQRDLWKQSKEPKVSTFSGASLTASGELTEPLKEFTDPTTVPKWQQGQDLGLQLEQTGAQSESQPKPPQRNMCVQCGKFIGAAEFGGKCSVCFTEEEDVEMTRPTAPSASIISVTQPPEELPSWRRSEEPATVTVIPPAISEEHSMISEHCKFGKCRNFASKFTYPYCHEHSRKSDRVRRIAAEPERCIRPGCDQPRAAKMNNYCTTCYLKRGFATEFEEKCRISSCTGTGEKKYDMYCSACHQRVPISKGGVPQQSSGSFTGPRPAETSYEHSLYATRPCVMPGCKRLGSASNNDLCDECYRQQVNIKLGPETTQRAQECLTPGCTMFGRPESLGYCSKCYKDTQTAKLGAVQYGSGNIMVLGTPEVVETTPGQSVTTLCRGHHCTKRAIPGTGGFCQSCSQPEERPPQPTVPHIRQTFPRQQPPDAVIGKGDVMGRLTKSEPISSKVAPAYNRHHSQTQGRMDWQPMKCKRPGCQNYGNPDKFGYCNECMAANLGLDQCDSMKNKTKTSLSGSALQ